MQSKKFRISLVLLVVLLLSALFTLVLTKSSYGDVNDKPKSTISITCKDNPSHWRNYEVPENYIALNGNKCTVNVPISEVMKWYDSTTLLGYNHQTNSGNLSYSFTWDGTVWKLDEGSITSVEVYGHTVTYDWVCSEYNQTVLYTMTTPACMGLTNVSFKGVIPTGNDYEKFVGWSDFREVGTNHYRVYGIWEVRNGYYEVEHRYYFVDRLGNRILEDSYITLPSSLPVGTEVSMGNGYILLDGNHNSTEYSVVFLSEPATIIADKAIRVLVEYERYEKVELTPSPTPSSTPSPEGSQVASNKGSEVKGNSGTEIEGGFGIKGSPGTEIGNGSEGNGNPGLGGNKGLGTPSKFEGNGSGSESSSLGVGNSRSGNQGNGSGVGSSSSGKGTLVNENAVKVSPAPVKTYTKFAETGEEGYLFMVSAVLIIVLGLALYKASK